ncbi:MAG: S9 family peptidase [Chlorobi bacterium]|nr:S9 family peptidase [Chlorobiota bacterium]
MKLRNILIALSVFLLFFGTARVHAQQIKENSGLPPKATEKPFEETICDTTLTDRYRYMEKLGDPEVTAWLKAQSTYARTMLDRIPGRNELIKKMRDFDSRKSAKIYNLAITDNDRYFYLKQTPSDETGKLYYRNGYTGTETLLFDPSTYNHKKDAHYTIGRIAPSDDGATVALTVYPDGSENATLLIVDTDSGKWYPEAINRSRFASPSWLPDGRSFLYNRLEPSGAAGTGPQYASKVWLHRIGTDPSNDREIFSSTLNTELGINPENIPLASYDKESGMLFAFVSNVDRRLQVYYAPAAELQQKTISWKSLFKPEDDIHDFAITDKELYLYTPKNAPGFRVLKTPLQNPDPNTAKVVIPEFRDAKLTGFVLTSEGIYYKLSRNGVQEELYHQDYGSYLSSKVTLPFKAGTISLSSKGFRFPEIWTVLTGWNRDYRRFRFDKTSFTFFDETLSSPARYPEYENLVVEELMVPSHDGVAMPLSLIYRKGLEKNANNPVLLYGYGAYGNSVTPFFSPFMLLWTLKGGIFAVPHVRGGGELGYRWHTAGMKTTKANTWKDAISGAEYLVKNGYSSPERIAINGASAGGIMVGRAFTERPDLFAAAIPQVGAMNPLRGETTANGPVNVPEFGTMKIPEECKALIAMDPYLHLRDGVNYPAALVTGGINDPRVIAWQPAKFAARMQAATASGKPVLLFTDFEAGHGMGNAKTKNFETLADVLSFGLWQTGHPEFQK